MNTRVCWKTKDKSIITFQDFPHQNRCFTCTYTKENKHVLTHLLRGKKYWQIRFRIKLTVHFYLKNASRFNTSKVTQSHNAIKKTTYSTSVAPYVFLLYIRLFRIQHRKPVFVQSNSLTRKHFLVLQVHPSCFFQEHKQPKHQARLVMHYLLRVKL